MPEEHEQESRNRCAMPRQDEHNDLNPLKCPGERPQYLALFDVPVNVLNRKRQRTTYTNPNWKVKLG
jgi:hypothetical protein